jgi:protein TonB
MARRMNKQATVEMRVLVSPTGEVVRVEQISPKAGFGIDQAALEAARKAKFKPGMRNGKPAEMWYLLKLQFKP